MTPIGSPVTGRTSGDVAGETGIDGVASFENLKAGYYIVSETKLPAGYVQTGSGSFYVKVENGEVKLVERGESGWVESDGNEKLTFTAATETNPAKVTVGNDAGTVLPSTGGPGTTLFTILGSILLAGAGLLLWRRRRRV